MYPRVRDFLNIVLVLIVSFIKNVIFCIFLLMFLFDRLLLEQEEQGSVPVDRLDGVELHVHLLLHPEPRLLPQCEQKLKLYPYSPTDLVSCISLYLVLIKYLHVLFILTRVDCPTFFIEIFLWFLIASFKEIQV